MREIYPMQISETEYEESERGQTLYDINFPGLYALNHLCPSWDSSCFTFCCNCRALEL